MGTLNEDLSAIKEVEDKIIANKVARFAYTDEAYTTNDANGVAEYNVNKEQNIPTADASVLKVNETVLSKGYRAQASSVTRMLLNHFFGRMSYNLNKVNDIVSNLIATLIGHRGTANGFATLDENGRIPYSQLPESAMEYKGQWNAETNTPTLADGTGTKGDFYIVSVGGTQNLGSGNIQFSANDRIIYDGSVWARLSAGAVQTVNNISPENGNVTLTGENIPVSSTDPTLLSAPLTTDRIADNAITNAKIKEPISVAKGGTGATTAKGAEFNITAGMTSKTSDFTDTTQITCVQESPSVSNGRFFQSSASYLWNYIKSKISSVLGLTKDNYGGKASTAETADRARNMYAQNLDLSSLDKTKFYPLVCYSDRDFAEVAICSESGPINIEYNQNRIHFAISTTGWNDTQFTLNIREYTCYENNEITIGCIARGLNDGAWAIWLRGGLHYLCFSRNCNLSLKTSDYTYGGEVYTVGTNYYGGTNTNVKVEFTPQSTIKSGAYSVRDIKAPNFIGNLTGNATTATNATNATNANKIVPNYTTVDITTVSSVTTKYIKLADCASDQAGTLQVFLGGGNLTDTLVINFGGGNSTEPMLCGYYSGNSHMVFSVIAKKGSTWASNYSIYVKINQVATCTVNVALLKGNCTINISESTTAPTNISEWEVGYGLFGDFIGTATNANNAYTGMVHTCTTASSTKDKTVSIPGFTLTQGACIRVKFQFGNKVTFPTLNVNSTGSHQILGSRGSLNVLIESNSDLSLRSGLGVASWDTGTVLDLYYDGSSWCVIGEPIVKRFYDGTASLHKNVSMLGNVQTSILW